MKKIIAVSALVLTVAILGSSLMVTVSGASESFTVAVDGKSSLEIVLPELSSAVDKYGAQILTNTLTRITGADFPVVAETAYNPDKPAIFVGLGSEGRKHCGRENPLDELMDQEHVTLCAGGNIFLYGRGVHGNLHAVLDFMEQSLGWRWYSVFENAFYPARPTIKLTPFERRKSFAFTSREVGMYWNPDFYYQNGINMRSERWGKDPSSAYVPFLRNDKFVHSLFAYIPPSPTVAYARTFKWLTNTNYFETNPEFFSLSASGERVSSLQLCFGNSALRAELTANILKHLEVEPGNQIITVDAVDNPGAFCNCSECTALVEEFESPGGPLYFYLLELCAFLQEQHPGVFVKTLAYRRTQTQKPPKLAEGQILPGNLIISFAPIEDCYFGDWTHPDPKLQETYNDLKEWNSLLPPGNLWAWLYPNPWGSGNLMPVGNVERNINQMRLMHAAGVRGIFTDHCGATSRSGWSELQSYVLYKLMQDLDCDTDAIIREFTDHQYGAASGLVRQYLTELEQGRKDMQELPPGVSYVSSNYDEQIFPYLTASNIFRWQALFDRMTEKVQESEQHLDNVRILRRELDFATLCRWFELQEKHADSFRDADTIAARIRAANDIVAPAGMKPRVLGADNLEDFMAVIRGGGQLKPLPESFDDLDESRIRQFLPTNHGRMEGKPRNVADEEAAFGYAVTVHNSDYPFQAGFYQWISRQPPSGVHGARIRIEKDQIEPGIYRFYELGEIEITPDCFIWFSAKSWSTHLEAGKRVFEPGAENRWRAWISMKFDGPDYGGKADENQVLVDRIVLYRLDSGQFGD